MTTVGWVHAVIDLPDRLVADGERFWSAVTGWPPGPPWTGHPELWSLRTEPHDYVHLQRIGGPPRVHIDLTVPDPDSEGDRLAQLGARRVARHDRWLTMTSPAGLPFCLCQEPPPDPRPAATAWPGGHRSRLAQVCVDVPAPAYETELAFWTTATGWAVRPSSRPEFCHLLPPPRMPVQLLVQRLGPDDDGNRARAHLDLGTDDIGAEVERVAALGARVIARHDGWTALVDPVGLPFCVTGQPPD